MSITTTPAKLAKTHPAMTRDELVTKVPMRLISHFTCEFEAQRTTRNDEHGITMLAVTPRMGKQWGNTSKTFYLDGSPTGYTTTDQLLEALNKRAKNGVPA